MADFRALILQRHRHLKWRAFDWLEAVLMVLCGVCIFMFTLTVFLDVVTRTLGTPWLWLQQVTTAFFAWGVFVGMARSGERRVGKGWRSLCDWSSDVCSSDLPCSSTSSPARSARPGFGCNKSPPLSSPGACSSAW